MKIGELVKQLKEIENQDREISIVIGNEDENTYVFDEFELHNIDSISEYFGSVELFCFDNYMFEQDYCYSIRDIIPKDILSKPVFNDEEYKALLRLMEYLCNNLPYDIINPMENTLLLDKKTNDELQFSKDMQTINECLQASEYVNENHKR